MVDTAGKFSLWSLEVFVACVEEGTVSAAAKRLGASISTVSQQLTNLEYALGTELMDRSTRPMSVTATGALFLTRAQNIVSEIALAKTELSQFDLSQMVSMRLGVIDDFDADVTPDLLVALSKRLENCRFLLESGGSYGLTQGLQSQQLDLVITAEPTRMEEWMDVHPLLVEPFILAAARGEIDPDGNVQDQLLSRPFIRYSSREMMGRQIEAHLTRLRLQIPNQFEFNNYHAILSMVADNAGWTITTPLGFLRAQRFNEDVELLPLPFKDLSRTISLIARRDVLDWIPAEVASLSRDLIREQMVAPLIEDYPWLAEKFEILG
ncbi:MAG: LysR family transcriptional regulator [Pseudomonadota bacterium]